MAITTEILRSYRAPRAVLRRHLQGGPREDRALVTLFAGCFLVFVSTLPGLARLAQLDPEVPLEARIGGALLSWMFVMPLVFYALAGLTRLALGVAGRPVTPYGARIALFWALLAASPIWLLHGLVAGFIGAGVAQLSVAVVLVAAFLYIWGAGLREAMAWEAENA